MDIPRAPQSQRKRYVQGGIALGALVLLTLLFSSLRPAVPSVDAGPLWVDTVRQGAMLRNMRGPGTLVPEHIRWISALTPARVERILELPGAKVKAGTVLLELSNPDVQIEALDAQRQLSAAEADLVTLHTNLEGQRLTEEGVVAETKTAFNQSQLDAAEAETLAVHNLTSRNDVSAKRDKAAELQVRLNVEQQRLQLLAMAVDSQIAAQKTQVERLRAIAEFQAARVRSMRVTAGEDGTLQDLPLQLGQWVVPGTILAKVVQPLNLKAVLRIPETQAKDLAIGQQASIDTRNGIVPGHVSRIDPASENATVGVDVTLDGPLPPGARPDLNVDGTITIERLPNVLYVGRPAFGEENSTVSMFEEVEGGRYAVRVQVQLGRASVTTVEVLRGLQKGDVVILSDMSRWDSADRIRLK